jgi:folate-binding protein YgfZ
MTTSSGDAERWNQGLANGFIFRIHGVSRFALTGSDRVRYLNGQCSNDVRKLGSESDPVQACILSARGKLDAVVWIWAEADRLIVECDTSLADKVAARLEKYIVADDVALDPLPAPENEWHVVGGNTPIPDPIRSQSIRSIQRLGTPGIDVCDAAFPESAESAGLVFADESMLTLLRVQNLVPVWDHELQTDTLPAEARLDKTAVDFHKGCYLGQEVVSRIESVGHANRMLRTFEVSQGPPPQTGDVFMHPSAPEKAVAEITTVARHFGLSKHVGLCYTLRGVKCGDQLTSADQSTRITISDSSL